MGEISELNEKLKKMVDMGVIHEEAPVSAFVHIAVEEKKDKKLVEIAKRIRALPIVRQVNIVTGDFDFIVLVHAENVKSLGRFVTEQLRKIPQIKKTVTSLILDSF